MRQDQCQQILSSITCNYKKNTLSVNFSVLYGSTERVNIVIIMRDNVMHDYVISDQFIGHYLLHGTNQTITFIL